MEYDDVDEVDHMSYVDDDETDDYYFDDDDQLNDNTIDDDETFAITNVDKSSTYPLEKRYTVLNEELIQRRQDEEISTVSSILSVSKAEAIVLLCYYNWCTSQVNEEWFANEHSVRNKVGLLLLSSSSNNSNNNNNDNYCCGICFDDELSSEQIRYATCGHKYCVPCWKKYIKISVNDTGLGSLLLKCPEPKCPAAIDRDMVTNIASEKTVRKYMEYLTRSYVEFKKKNNIKWCPAPGCKNAIEFETSSESNNYDVACECRHEFCFNCEAEEPHRPVECDIVKAWNMKNKSEAENTKWILAYSKPCPKCNRPIEKNLGCNHMTCGPPCSHHFCWLCGNALGRSENYTCKCNAFHNSQQNKPLNAEDSQREIAKRSLERYTHYYERWASNSKSRDKARSDLTEMKAVKMQHLCDRLGAEKSLELDFIVQAWEQIIECRRVLKWTYAYGFFKLEHEHTKRRFFEYIQGEAERALERLHFCAERELQAFCVGNGAVDEKEFSAFRIKLLGLTKVTGTFFDNLVKGLENGLSEVRKDKKNKNKNKNKDQELEYWGCDRCSYLNPVSTLTCLMCLHQ